jgi:hypothetical protein
VGDGGSAPPHFHPDPPEPDKCLSNPVTIVDKDGNPTHGLDGTKYYVPQGIDNNYINRVAEHLYQLRGDKIAAYKELWDMYKNPDNPYFIDFKDYGTSQGPEGSRSAGQETYWSDYAGKNVTSSYFEPFGNFLYGYMLTAAGLSQDEIRTIAAYVQEGGRGGLSGIIHGDDPQDQVHVTYGIVTAQHFLPDPQAQRPIDIDSTPCQVQQQSAGG